jgi:hypothetical protein
MLCLHHSRKARVMQISRFKVYGLYDWMFANKLENSRLSNHLEGYRLLLKKESISELSHSSNVSYSSANFGSVLISLYEKTRGGLCGKQGGQILERF